MYIHVCLCACLQVPQMLFSGLFLSVSLIPSGLRWLQYVSYLKYGINLFYIAEVRFPPTRFCIFDRN